MNSELTREQIERHMQALEATIRDIPQSNYSREQIKIHSLALRALDMEPKPIEDAPRDGSSLLLFTKFDGDDDLDIPAFSEWQIGYWDGGYFDPNGNFSRDEGWSTSKIGTPIHFIPLSALPTPKDN